MNEHGCSSWFCYFKGRTKGMHTNRICQCSLNLVREASPYGKKAATLNKVLKRLHDRIAELEAQVEASAEFDQQVYNDQERVLIEYEDKLEKLERELEELR